MNLVLLFVLGAIWGTSFLFIKIVVSEIGPFTLVTGRLGLAALLIWALVWIRRAQKTTQPRNLWPIYAVVGMLNGALPFSLISWGEQYIPSGWAALLQATTPLFTILFAHVLTHDDRINKRKALGVALGFLGVGLLIWPELQAGVTTSVWGMLAIVGSSISYAVASIFARKKLHSEPAMVSAAGQFTMGFLYILPVAFIFETPRQILQPGALSGRALASWAALAILGTVVAYTLYYILLARTSATFTTMVTYIVPINGLILGALILGEGITPMIVASLVLVLGGVLLVRQG
jgi:drug/metabolite transporter (DMT)-like permease